MPSPLPPAIPPQFRLPPHSSPPRAQLSSYKDSAGHPALGEALFEAAEAGDMHAVQKILGEGTHPDDYVRASTTTTPRSSTTSTTTARSTRAMS